MIERANGGNTVPQIFIGATHVGGCDDLYALDGEGKLDPLAERSVSRADRMTASTGKTFRVGLIQMRTGRTPQANLDAAAKLIGEAKSAGADYVQTPEMTNIMEVNREKLFAAIVDEENDTSLATFRELARELGDLSPHRLAGDQACRPTRRPTAPS